MRAQLRRIRGPLLVGGLIAGSAVLVWLGFAGGLPPGHGALFAAAIVAFLASDQLCASFLRARRAAVSRAAGPR